MFRRIILLFWCVNSGPVYEILCNVWICCQHMEAFKKYVDESDEMIRQIEEDSDREIVTMKRKFEKEIVELKDMIEVMFSFILWIVSSLF